MSSFCEDKSQISNYPDGIFAEARNELSIRCMQWAQGIHEKNTTVGSAEQLIEIAKQPQSALRIAVLPLVPKEKTWEVEDFRKLVKHFSIPSSVLAERIRSVGYAFGSRTLQDKTENAWCHFLCRNIILDKDGAIQHMGYVHDNDSQVKQSANNMWTMCDFFLHVRPATQQSQKAVTLLCFGAPKGVVERFERLQDEDSWTDVMDEPYLLFDILFEEIHGFFENAVSLLRGAVKPEEKAALERAGRHGRFETPGDTVNFQNLHNIQTNCVFMVEGASASMATLEAIATKLRRVKRDPETHLTAAAEDAIECRRRNFHSTSLRLQSIEKRMLNVIQMTQTILTQADSAVLKADSRAMKLIAALTLVFLPATGVASVFDTPFFDNDTARLIVVANFWIFWAVSLPLTLGVGALCYAWYYLPRLPEDHRLRRYMGLFRQHRPRLWSKRPIARRVTTLSQQGHEMATPV